LYLFYRVCEYVDNCEWRLRKVREIEQKKKGLHIGVITMIVLELAWRLLKAVVVLLISIISKYNHHFIIRTYK